ncbi:phosphoglucan phosphatase LSF2 [Pyrus ussuriensis x Pyrus communis]|uniref:Phosphoglucan phosphatase LSF2 n=1 Tax=Pyrus ussuriensis x Pyrus communis TaxID=2448454 RepID=A0A5N5F5C4_9ROSA|nr:phosphoglucan phosphatase LSF2 [Pyrus ussuriensis x Pyrus communis]
MKKMMRNPYEYHHDMGHLNGIEIFRFFKLTNCSKLIATVTVQLNAAYDALTSKRPCGPSKRAIRGATYDLTKKDPWKEPHENLPEYAFEDIADWERNLIRDRVCSLPGT